MTTFLIDDKKEEKKRKTWDQQIFSNFKIQAVGEVEEYVPWLARLEADETLEIPEEFIGPEGIKMHKLLKKYPLLGQEYEVVTKTCTDVMMKQIEEDGYMGHVFLKDGMKKLKFVQVYGHKDFKKK